MKLTTRSASSSDGTFFDEVFRGRNESQMVGKVVGSRSYDRLTIEREKGFEPGST